MATVADGRAALAAGRLDDAQAAFLTNYDAAPGACAIGLARVALARGDAPRAENLARTATENGAEEGTSLLAEAIGEQGRRAEAERLAAHAVDVSPHDPYARMVLGEQVVRQGRWVEGARIFEEAIALDHEGRTAPFLRRLLSDLAAARRAGKVPVETVSQFLDRVGPAAVGHSPLDQIIDDAWRELSGGDGPRRTLSEATTPAAAPPPVQRPPAPAPPASPASPPTPAAAAAPPRRADVAARGPEAPVRGYVQRDLPALQEVMQLDLALNRELEALVIPMGLPQWPSNIERKLDTLPPMRPQRLNFTQERMKRTTLRLTSGSVDSEILIGRALENLLRATEVGLATRPGFDAVGMTKMEIALWDGALERIKPVPDVYGAIAPMDYATLALGAYLGDAILRRTDATWTFAERALGSVVQVGRQTLAPFETARAWLDAADRDEVHLEEIVGRALQEGRERLRRPPRFDPTEDLEGTALCRKLAELWMVFRGHPVSVAQTDVAEGIRPLNVLDEIVFFAMDARFAPPFASGPGHSGRIGDDIALAYVRGTGEFLCLASRKHFARVVGVLVSSLDAESAQIVLDMFQSFHRPKLSVAPGARVDTSEGTEALFFSTHGSEHVLRHEPASPVAWRLSIARPS